MVSGRSFLTLAPALVRVTPRGFVLLAGSPEFSLNGTLKRHDFVPHGRIIIAKIGEMLGKRPALVAPEAVCLFAVKLLKHLNTPLYVCDTVFSGKRNYF